VKRLLPLSAALLATACQATSYMIGQLKILELRAVPLDVLERLVDDYIAWKTG